MEVSCDVEAVFLVAVADVWAESSTVCYKSQEDGDGEG